MYEFINDNGVTVKIEFQITNSKLAKWRKLGQRKKIEKIHTNNISINTCIQFSLSITVSDTIPHVFGNILNGINKHTLLHV